MSEPIDLLGERARRAEPIAHYNLTLRVARNDDETVWDWTAEHVVQADHDTLETTRGLVLALRQAAGQVERDGGAAIPPRAPGRLQKILARLPERWRRTIHNAVAHPVSEALHLIGAARLSARVHDATVPAGGEL